MEQESARLLARYRDGDAGAADELVRRYYNRLTGLARTRLSEKLARRVDAEDIVQSVFRSFFINVHEGRYELQRSGDLWRLLAAITVNKVLRQAEHHGHQKRALDREVPLAGTANNPLREAELFASDPTENDAVAVVDELQHVMSNLSETNRQMLELRLQGKSLGEIATDAGVSERTVRRFLEKVRETLQRRLFDARD